MSPTLEELGGDDAQPLHAPAQEGLAAEAEADMVPTSSHVSEKITLTTAGR